MDERECEVCGDSVLHLSSAGWCDGCEEAMALAADPCGGNVPGGPGCSCDPPM